MSQSPKKPPFDAAPTETPELLQKDLSLDRRNRRVPTFEELRASLAPTDPARPVVPRTLGGARGPAAPPQASPPSSANATTLPGRPEGVEGPRLTSQPVEPRPPQNDATGVLAPRQPARQPPPSPTDWAANPTLPGAGQAPIITPQQPGTPGTGGRPGESRFGAGYRPPAQPAQPPPQRAAPQPAPARPPPAAPPGLAQRAPVPATREQPAQPPVPPSALVSSGYRAMPGALPAHMLVTQPGLTSPFLPPTPSSQQPAPPAPPAPRAEPLARQRASQPVDRAALDAALSPAPARPEPVARQRVSQPLDRASLDAALSPIPARPEPAARQRVSQPLDREALDAALSPAPARPEPAPRQRASQPLDAPLDRAPRPQPQAAPVEETVVASPAGLFRRVVAWLVDVAVIGGVAGGFVFAATMVIAPKGVHLFKSLAAIALPAALLAGILAFVYTTLFAFLFRGRTPGRLLTGIRLVDGSGAAPGPGRALVRAGLSLVSFALFLSGFWLALFDRRGQTLHDKLARTFVVRLQT